MSKLKRLLWPLVTCLLFLYPAYFLEDLMRELQAGATAQALFILRHGVGVGIWLAGAWLLNEFMHVLAWDRLSQPVPTILKHIFSILIFGIAITGIFGFVFGQSVTGIWATSGVFGLVFGFAGRSLIADLFCGIALHLDPPFRIGDWIEWREGNEEILARVEQINWRSTRVHARDDTKTLFIPNSHLSSVAITNVFAPLGRTRQIVRIPLDPFEDLTRAMRVLLAGALTAEGPLADPEPDVLIESVGPEGTTIQIRYWHEPETSIAKVRGAVLLSVLQALAKAGIQTARNRHEVLTAPLQVDRVERQDPLSILRRLEIFAGFEDSEIESIASQAERLEYEAGAKIVVQGEPGASLFFVLEGLLDVHIEQSGKPSLRVNRLGPGQYFGEMSLLTGDPRSATVSAATSAVVYQVSKVVLEPILAARPSVVHELAETVTRRQLQNRSSLQSASTREAEAGHESFAKQMLAKIMGYFAS